MKIRIAARKSDLARLQARRVGDALLEKEPSLEIEYKFRESLGDQNQDDPLWKMPERGVFTQDFLGDLVAGHCDLVVHSWKDLPLDSRQETVIAATLPRADARDLMIVKRSTWSRALERDSFRLLSSSPRRAYNLESFLQRALPHPFKKIEFEVVRGNVQTRLRKLLANDGVDALVVAKAAVDRLLQSTEEEFRETREFVAQTLAQCRLMVLPYRENPSAAAQGALAVEIKKGRSDLEALLAKIHCARSFASAQAEREILGTYGGGCHQKIGVSVIDCSWGQVLSLRGLTSAGEVLNQWKIQSGEAAASFSLEQSWPRKGEKNKFFEREPILNIPFPQGTNAFWVAREEAWPSDWKAPEGAILWTSGLETWFKLARRGLWITGSNEGLGEDRGTGLEPLFSDRLRWLKLSHDRSPEVSMPRLITYRLKDLAPTELTPLAERLSQKTHFFWMSGTQFEKALEIAPQIRHAHHACGPGNTWHALRKVLGPQSSIELRLSFDDWMKNGLIKKPNS